MLSLLYLGLRNGGDPWRLLLVILLAAVEVALFLMPLLKPFRRFWTGFGNANNRMS